jgi:hypothetical protein
MTCSIELSCSVCDKFKDYLYRQRFTVLTDTNPVAYVLTTAKLDAVCKYSMHCLMFESRACIEYNLLDHQRLLLTNLLQLFLVKLKTFNV